MIRRRYELTFLTAERRGVNAEEHRNGRSSTESAASTFCVSQTVQNVQFASARDDRYRQLPPDGFDAGLARGGLSTLPTFALRVLPSLSMIVTCWFGFTLILRSDAANGADNANIALL